MNTHDKLELPPMPEGMILEGIWAVPVDEVIAYRDACINAAIEADRKRMGEPVGYVSPSAIKRLKAGGNAIVGGMIQGFDVPLYAAPQPAEPVKNTCKKCNGMGVESTRFHGVWPNGEECLEPIKCDQCDGFGTTSAAELVKGLSAGQLAEILTAYITPEIIGEALEKLENAPWELSAPVKVPNALPSGTNYSVEPHGNGYAIYQGRDGLHHGANLAHLTECTPEFSKRIESALNAMSEPVKVPSKLSNAEILSLAYDVGAMPEQATDATLVRFARALLARYGQAAHQGGQQ